MPHQNISRPFGATQEEIADFQRHGAVCLRHLLTTEQVELLREGIESNLKHPSPRPRLPAVRTILAVLSKTSFFLLCYIIDEARTACRCLDVSLMTKLVEYIANGNE